MMTMKPDTTFLTCKAIGFGLMFLLWLQEGEQAGFFLLLFFVLLSLLRWRFPSLRATLLIDAVVCALAFPVWASVYYFIVLILFEGMYRRFYWVALVVIYSAFLVGYDVQIVALIACGGLAGLVLGKWEQESQEKFVHRDAKAEEYYELEDVKNEIVATLPQIESMTAVAERARIAREIHDNAGHEIVAAYISLQTVRGLLPVDDKETLELYDAALERLQNGVNKIRETAHNLQTVTTLGVGSLLEICEKFPFCPAKFRTFGDTSKVPIYIWQILESCVNESLTNVARHTSASYVRVELDVTAHIVRLSVENDGIQKTKRVNLGNGLNNMRHRVTSVGGTFSVDSKKTFRMVCVMPISSQNNENS